MNERETLKINEKGHLEIGGADCVELVRDFGTPLYVFDEAYIRKMMRVYRDTLAKHYGVKSNHVAAWITRAINKLRADKYFSCLQN